MRLSKRMKWIIGASVVTLVVLVTALRPETVIVDLVAVERGPMMVTVDEEGVTRMREHAVIAAPVSGRVESSALAVGDPVTRGEVVARIAPVPLDARAREQAEAALAGARSRQAEAAARVLQADVALAQASRDRGRMERMAAAGGVSDREVETAVMAEQVRSRDVEAARAVAAAAADAERSARVALLGAGTGATPAALIAVRTPLTGQVLRLVEEYDRVVPAGTPLLEVGRPGDIEVVVDVLSGDATRIPVQAPVLVRIPQGDEVGGRIERIEPAAFTKVSPLGVEEQRVNVVVRLDTPVSGLGHQFRVLASIVLWRAESVLTVPSTSLVPMDEGWGVLVVRDGRARLQPVTLGHHGAREVEVTRGLEAGDRIVRHPDERVTDGTRVSGRG